MGNQDTAEFRFFPSIPAYTKHHLQTLSTPAARDLLDRVLARPVIDWTMEDFNTPMDTTGASVLVSLFMDYAQALRPWGITSSQRGFWLGLLVSRIPLDYFPLFRVAIGPWGLLQKSCLWHRAHPCRKVIYAQRRPSSSSRMMDFGGISIHQDWREVISYKSPSPLLGLYLLDAGLSAAIRQQSHTELLALIYTLGAFAQLAKTRASVFCPPTWLLLSCPEAVTPTSSDPPLLDKIEL